MKLPDNRDPLVGQHLSGEVFNKRTVGHAMSPLGSTGSDHSGHKEPVDDEDCLKSLTFDAPPPRIDAFLRALDPWVGLQGRGDG
jgi:hypothetical protein